MMPKHDVTEKFRRGAARKRNVLVTFMTSSCPLSPKVEASLSAPLYVCLKDEG